MSAVRVEVVCALPLRQLVRNCELPAGADAAAAVAASAILEAFPELAGVTLSVIHNGRPAQPGQPLRDGDRVELCRPLAQDPRQTRRQRLRARAGDGPGA